MSDTSRPADPRGFRLLLALAAALAAFLLGDIRTAPPAPRGTDTPVAEFSAARARDELRHFLGDGAPRPVGSEANRAARERLVERMRELGLEPRTERHWIVLPSQTTSAWVENVIGTVRAGIERERLPAVVLCAHHDSVPAGPGAADDGAGVAVLLETARALKAGPPLPRDVVLLVTDGEEAGLLGARVHVKAHGAGGIAAVVNVEARGTSGPSLMFETGPGTAATVAAWASHAPRPLSSSLFAEVYHRMPNDTDLSVFLREGVPALNFAFTGRVQHYHTPLDSFLNVDPASLQHHGDNVLAAARGLAAAGRLAADAGEIAWFDVLGVGVVRWPARATTWIALAALALVVVATARRIASSSQTVGGAVLGLGAALAVLVAGMGAAWGLGAMLGATPALPGPFVAHPAGMIAVAAGCAAFAAGVAGLLLGRRADAHASAWSGAWLLAAAGGVAIALEMPGGAYVLAVPAFVAGAIGVCAPRGSLVPASSAGLVAGAVLWLPLTGPLTDSLGVRPLLVPAVPFALTALALLPFAADGGPRRWTVGAGGLVVAAAGCVATLASAPWTPELPRAVNIAWTRDADDHHASWIVRSDGPVPPEMLAAAEFGDETERLVPWAEARGWPAEAPLVDLPAPALDGLQTREADGSRRVTFRLRSPRGAPFVQLVVRPDARLRRMAVGGEAVPPETMRRGPSGPYVVSCRTTPPEGVEVMLEFAGTARTDAYLSDTSYGLPPEASALAGARPSGAAPRQDGDVTVVWRKVKL